MLPTQRADCQARFCTAEDDVAATMFPFVRCAYLSSHSTATRHVHSPHMRSLLALFTLTLVPFAAAELPPSVYRDLQAKAPEVAVITVTSVSHSAKKREGDVLDTVTLVAKVRRVSRTRRHLHKGDFITISYTHVTHSQSIAGPSEIPILSKGQTVPAYLTFVSQHAFAPAAKGHSFDTVK